MSLLAHHLQHSKISYFTKFKRSRDPPHILFWVVCHACTSISCYQPAHQIWSA